MPRAAGPLHSRDLKIGLGLSRICLRAYAPYPNHFLESENACIYSHSRETLRSLAFMLTRTYFERRAQVVE